MLGRLWRERLAHKSVITVWLISYIVVLTVPLVFGGTLYFYFDSSMERQLSRQGDAMVSLLVEENDNAVMNNMRMIAAVSMNTKVQEAFNMSLPITKEDNKTLRYVTDEISASYTQFYDLKRDAEFFAYMKNINMIVDKDRVYSPDIYYRLAYDSTGEGYDEWLKSIQSPAPAYFQIRNKNGKNSIRYVTPFPRHTATNGSYVIEQRDMPLEENLSEMMENEIFVEYAIISSSGALYQNTKMFDGVDFGDENNSYLTISPGSKINYDGKSYYFFRRTSSATGFRYIVAVSGHESERLMLTMRLLGLLMLAASVLGGGILIWIMLKYNYTPMEQIVESLRSLNLVSEKSGNELSFIQDALHMVLKENKNINKVVDKQREKLREYILYELILGQAEHDGINIQEMQKCGICFLSENFLVAVLRIENNDEFFDEENISDAEKARIELFLFDNIFNDYFTQEAAGYVVNVGGDPCIIISVPEHTANIDVNEKLIKLKSFVEEELNIYFTMSVSGIYQGIGGIAEAYREAASQMEYKFSLGTQAVILPDSMPDFDISQYEFSYERERKLTNCIKASDAEGAREIIDEIFNNQNMSIEIERCLVYNISGVLLRLIDTDADKKQYYKENAQFLMGFDTLEDFRKRVNTVIDRLCSRELPSSDGDLLCAKVIKIINSQYADPNLSVSNIAEQIGLQYVYMSVAFKKYSGEGVLEHIGKVRVEKSKELLKDPLISIDDVAAQVGYNEKKTYVRVFKKNEGITPAKFRKYLIEQFDTSETNE